MIRLTWSGIITATLVLALGIGTNWLSAAPDRADVAAGIEADTNWGGRPR